jgi:hypothetical protein
VPLPLNAANAATFSPPAIEPLSRRPPAETGVPPAVELLPSEGPWMAEAAPSGVPGPSILAILLFLFALGGSVVKAEPSLTMRSGKHWLYLIVGRLSLVPAALLGTLFLFMWVATEHQDTWANPDLLWANPLAWALLLPGSYDRKWGRVVRWMLVVGVLVWSVMHLAAGPTPSPTGFLAGSVALAAQPRMLFLRIFKK